MVHKHLHFLEKRKKLVISLKSSEQLGGNAHGKLHFVCTFKIMLLKFQPSIDYHLLIISCLTFISCNFRSGGGANPQPFIFLLLLIIVVVIIVIIIFFFSKRKVKLTGIIWRLSFLFALVLHINFFFKVNFRNWAIYTLQKKLKHPIILCNHMFILRSWLLFYILFNIEKKVLIYIF